MNITEDGIYLYHMQQQSQLDEYLTNTEEKEISDKTNDYMVTTESRYQ